MNILSKHTIKLTKDQLRAYLSWFFGAEDEQLASCKTPSNMVACLVNLEATSNQGLVANCKTELRCKSVMLNHFLAKLLKTTKMTCHQMDQEEYTYIQEGDPTIKHFCILNLWAMMRVRRFGPRPRSAPTTLRPSSPTSPLPHATPAFQLSSQKMLDIKHQIEPEKGISYKPYCFMTLLFDKFSGYNNEMFHYKFITARFAYNKGKTTQEKVFTSKQSTRWSKSLAPGLT
jgi:hypothetical protein